MAQSETDTIIIIILVPVPSTPSFVEDVAILLPGAMHSVALFDINQILHDIFCHIIENKYLRRYVLRRLPN